MKVAVITGAASGIGLALSTIYLQQGHHVLLVDKNAERLQEKAQELSSQFSDLVHYKTCDITKLNEVQSLVHFAEQQLGHVNWLYNNAGIMGDLMPVWELESEQIKKVMDVNLFGMHHVIQVFIPLLFKQKCSSHIINMASLYALSSGSQMAAYAMSKHAVLALSEALYFDLKRLEKPVDVSVVFPSFTDTALLSHSPTQNSAFQDSLKHLLSHSRPAADVALHIAQEVEQKKFYILPDKEVKGYCEERNKAIVLQEEPHVNNIEKLVRSLIKRVGGKE